MIRFVQYIKKIPNPGFAAPTEESEFYKWSYIAHTEPKNREAWVMKQYIPGSLEARGHKFFFFDIANYSEGYEYQFYVFRKITNKIKPN